MKILKILGCFTLTAILLTANGDSESIIVRTQTGDVRGYKITVDGADIFSFLGIPYAVPPIGQLRFKESKPVEPWEGVHDASRFSALCIQHTELPLFEWKPVGDYTFSEDCLYLNIWVPIGGNTKKEVMVWIHGGGFNTGSASLDVYDGRKIAAEADVIVVSFNYRLGALGFLYAGTKDAPGNMGLKDQVLALRWIKDNIEEFRGDNSKVTVFGESAGSMSVSAHMLSPMTRGLFSRAIMQSGTAYHPSIYINNTIALYISNQFASLCHCRSGDATLASSSSVMHCLRSLSAEEIAATENKMVGPFMSSFLPIYGDSYLPNHPLEEIKAGKIQNISVLVGNVMDEGSFFLGFLDRPLLEVNNPMITKEHAEKNLKKAYSMLGGEATRDIVNYYLSDVKNNHGSIVERTYNALGDYVFYCPAVFLSETLATYGLKVYHYIFYHRRYIVPYKEWLGVPHFEDVPFVFGTHLNHTETDIKFSNKIIGVWTSFAKNGKPNDGNGMALLSYKKDHRISTVIKPDNVTFVNPYKDACKFWRKYFERI